ncbi:hypothetical protein HNQ99_000402 [Rhizorhapis suberifaciens]|uniref:Uncharacterized protein n=1 Tax=Rhizorhapis suberifaciens TaxID=13656 RepID=A0A840HPZ3_9SPHN|nr:hypothetical protein [Rhizorhapis suberifaciens]
MVSDGPSRTADCVVTRGNPSIARQHPVRAMERLRQAGLLASGSSLAARLPGFASSGLRGHKLAGYSCGGSPGLW